MDSLKKVLGLGTREHVALVGAGGKTTLMFALAEELQRLGESVVTTTTTKIWHREAPKSPCAIIIEQENSWRESLWQGLQSHGHVFLGKEILDIGKIQGISPSLLDEIYQDQGMDYLIVEADGSAGHPVKAPDAHEPVIAKSATTVVAMLGLEALGQTIGPETVFRGDIFSRLTGTKPGQKLTASSLTKLFLAAGGLFKGTPDSAKRVVFLNKSDLLTQEKEAQDLVSRIVEKDYQTIDRIVMGSVARGEYHAVLLGRR